MKNLILLLIAVFSVSNGVVMAQKCGSSLNMSLIQKENPALYNRLLQIEEHTDTFVKNQSSKSTKGSNIIRIPVVVHVLYNNSAQNISYSQITSQIDVLNEDFRRQNADASNTPTAFSSIASDSEIEFFLACVDPNGNATNGITRTYTNLNQFPRIPNPDNTTNETATKIKFAALGGHDAWPSDRYLNIWVCNLGNALGYAQFPGIGQANTDGVVVRYNSFGRTGTLNPPYDKGRTATHEVGHWLNLLHIWGNDDDENGYCTPNECTGTDNVADTPNQGERNYGCPSFPKTDCCSTASPGVMFMNYMDYTDDACMNLYTQGQKSRMRALFSPGGFRACFATNTLMDKWCKSEISFSAPTTVCSAGASFGINNLPSGTTINWTNSTNITRNSSQGANPCTFSANGNVNGSGWIKATITSSNCGGSIVVQKTIWVGKPDSNLLYFERMFASSPHTLISGNNPIVVTHGYLQQEITQYYWDMDASWTNFAPNGIFINVDGSTTSGGGGLDISVKATNACGTCAFSNPTTFTIISGYMFSIYPNPTSETLTIKRLQANESMERGSQKADVTDYGSYELYDFSSNLILKGKLSNQNNIDVSRYKKGMYLLKIISKDKTKTHQIIIE